MTPWLRPGLALLGDDFPLPLDRPFTFRQAEASGISRHHVRVLTAAGLLRRMVKGVYVAAQVPDSIVLRGQALLLVVPPLTSTGAKIFCVASPGTWTEYGATTSGARAATWTRSWCAGSTVLARRSVVRRS